MQTQTKQTVTQRLRKAIAPKKVADRVKCAMIGTATFIDTCILSVANAQAADKDPRTVVINIMDKIVDLFPAIGIVVAGIGAFKLFMAFRNDQPDAYSGAAKDIVVGVVLVIFKSFIWSTLTTQLTP